MSEKSNCKNSLLDSLNKKDTVLRGNLPLTSSLLCSQSTLSNTSSATSRIGLTSSDIKNELSKICSLKTSLQSSRLNNPLLSTSSTLSSESLLKSSKLLQQANLLASSSLSTVKGAQGLDLQSSTLFKSPLIESSLTKLSLAQSADGSNKPSTSELSCLGQKASEAISPSKKSSPTKRSHNNAEVTQKKKKLESTTGEITSQVVKQYAINAPDYLLKIEDRYEDIEVDPPMFVSPYKDVRLYPGLDSDSLIIYKRKFINSVSGSLLSQPNFSNPYDDTRNEILHTAYFIVSEDPEFILKVALYTRRELNIRSTCNLLLAFAASISPCNKFLKKYFSAAILLPSDWIEVAELAQTLDERKEHKGSLPASLRKAMTSKFPDFDKYQLAKYNKENSGQRKKAKAKKIEQENKEKVEHENKEKVESVETVDHFGFESLKPKEDLKKHLTIKQLIRKMHIKEPVEHVMSIIGKKYPATSAEFYKSRLPGTWDEEQAGKRMKLPVPETWETQVSLKGNKAQTWEDLIDHKKLPYMAMLRNLRNLIKAGISQKHHNFVLRRLCDQKSVVNSKQFPFRFFSAYVVLNELEEAFINNQQEIIADAEAKAGNSTQQFDTRGGGKRGRINTRGKGLTGGARGGIVKPGRGAGRGRGARRGRGRGSGRGRGGTRGGASTTEGQPSADANVIPWWVLKRKEKESKQIKEVPYDSNLIQRYRKALDSAVKIATVHNVTPIKGRSIILCQVGESMRTPCTSAKGLGKPRTVEEVCVLMGLMCKYSCEECELIVFNEHGYTAVELQKGTILDNMDRVLTAEIPKNEKDMVFSVPFAVLAEKLIHRIQVDNLLVFGDKFQPDSIKGRILCNFLRNYRFIVNPNILFVSVKLDAKKSGVDTKLTNSITLEPHLMNNVYLSGYSDSILRFIAERSNGGLVSHVDKIDVAYQLAAVPKYQTQIGVNDDYIPKLRPIFAPTPRWRTVRVFISSTFRDMHGERDLLTRFVFPQLRAMGRKSFIHVHEVDLRWGLTEEDTRDKRTLQICMQEVSQCQLFVGLLGERYGWTPSSDQIPDSQEFDWIRNYRPGASITELEMELAALSRVKDAKKTAFFYFRNNSFQKDIPKGLEQEFQCESEANKAMMASLKNRIRKSGLEVYDGYPCHWGGCVDGKPMVAGLEEFGARVLNNLANAINLLFPPEDIPLTEEEHISKLQWAFVESYSSEFIGRKTLVNQIISKINSTKSGVLGLVGKPGSGKTALMCKTVMEYTKGKEKEYTPSAMVNIAGAAPGSINLRSTLRRLAVQINILFGRKQVIPQDFKGLLQSLRDLLADAGCLCPSKFVVFLDGVDQMDNTNEPWNLEWLPTPVPDNVVIVISAVEDKKTHHSLQRLGIEVSKMEGLDMWDKADLVRQTLAKHRKSLDETGFGNQMKLLMLKKDSHSPLYLKLACEELRVFGVFEKISDKLKSLPHSTALILQEVMKRLEEDHGTDIVSVALSLLAVVRDGLESEEMYELLNLYQSFSTKMFKPQDITQHRLELKDQMPPLKFTFLARSIMNFLNPSSSWSTKLSLGNQEMFVAVRTRYFKSLDGSWETRLHHLLAGYFWKLADPLQDDTWQSKNGRAFNELPHHLKCAGSFLELEKIICNFKFIQAKCSMGLVPQLLDDFTPKVTTSNKTQDKQTTFFSMPRVEQYKSFVSRNWEILASFPSLLWQQAMTEPNGSITYRDILSIRSEVSTFPPYMEWLNKPEKESYCYLTLSNFKLPPTSLAVSLDGSKFVTGSQDGTVQLYETSTGKELRMFIGHAGEVTDLCFVGSSLLCSASSDTSLCLWDVEHGHRVHVLKDHQRQVSSCASNKSGQLVASGGWDCMVFVWDVATGKPLCDFDIGCPVNCVKFHPVEEQVVVGSWDSLIRIYNYFHKTRIAILRGHSTSVRDVSCSVDGRHIASAALDGDIKIWAANKGTEVGNIKGHLGPISKLTYSPSGHELVTAGEDHKVKVWSGQLGVPLKTIHHDKHGPAVSVAISPSGLMVAVGYHLGLIRVYDLNTGVRMFEMKLISCAVRAVTFSKDNSYVLFGCEDNAVMVLDSKQGSKVCKLVGHTREVVCLATSKTYIASGGEDFVCCLYENLNQLKSSKQSKPGAILKGHEGPVTACSFNFDETLLATVSRDASVRVYTVRDCLISDDPKPTLTLTACHADWINSCQFSNTSNFLVTASNDFNLKVWDIKTGTEKVTLTGHASAINCVAYKYGCIVSASSDGHVKVWSHKGVPITTLLGHTLRVNACDMIVRCKNNTGDEEKEKSWAEMTDMEVDGKTETKTFSQRNINLQDVVVVTAGDDGDVWIWRPLQANNQATLTGHSDRVLSVDSDKFSNIVSCSLDKSVRIWKPSDNTEDEKNKHEVTVTFITKSPTYEFLVTGSRDGIVKIWTVEGNQINATLSLQAHETSVNCGSVYSKSNIFVTGGDDCTITFWEILERKEGLLVRKKSSFEVEMPVVSILALEYAGQLVYTTLSGGVFFYDGTPQLIHRCRDYDDLKSEGRRIYPIDIWYQTMYWDAAWKTLLLGTTFNCFHKLKVDLDCGVFSVSEIYSPRECIIDRAPMDEISDYSHDQSNRCINNGILCLARSYDEDILFTGDALGQIFYYYNQLNQFKVIKIHQSAITGLACSRNIIITASTDSTIKVWRHRADTMTLTQIGQFFAPSPLTSLLIGECENDFVHAKIQIFAGDQLGNILQLVWNC